MILLDTNVVSELTRARPHLNVEAYFRRQPPESLFTSSVCEAEIRYGLARMPAGRRRTELVGRITAFLAAAFPGRILAFDTSAAAAYGAIRAAREAAGRPISVQDAMIAATARAYGLAVVTRDGGDFVGCGIRIVDPWSGS